MTELDGQGPGSILFRVTQWVAEHGKPAIYRPPYVGPHKQFKHCEAALMLASMNFTWSDGTS